MLAMVPLGACSNSQMEGEENSDDNAGASVVDSVKYPVVTVDSLRPGMMRVAPNGASVLLGNGRMRVNLDYDYSLGVHEVTCAEFEEVSEKETWFFYLDCTRDELPVTNVSYYDAVLAEHGVTRAQFDSSLVWYTAHPQFFNKIYPKALKDLEAEEEAFNELYAEELAGMSNKKSEVSPQHSTFSRTDLDSVLWVNGSGQRALGDAERIRKLVETMGKTAPHSSLQKRKIISA